VLGDETPLRVALLPRRGARRRLGRHRRGAQGARPHIGEGRDRRAPALVVAINETMRAAASSDQVVGAQYERLLWITRIGGALADCDWRLAPAPNSSGALRGAPLRHLCVS